jgi:hypothetical protein
MEDYGIIGGGIAGLYAALHLAKRYPSAKISLFEKYRIFGGRVLTFREGGYRWEMGAGRFHSSHTLFRELLKQYGLHEVPIPSETKWIETYGSAVVPNLWEESLQTWLEEVKRLPNEMLATHTLFELLTQIFGETKASELVAPFPYYGEVYTLRADLALKSFEAEMGTHSNYFICPEGYDTLIERMVADCKKHGVKLYSNYECLSFAPASGTTVSLWFATGPLKLKMDRPVKQIRAKTVILALHADALRKIPQTQGLSILKDVKMEPLHRIYAVFPVDKKTGQAWFGDIGRFVTRTPIRYFIPIDASKGITMISYTDGDDTIPWMNLAKGAQPSEETLGFLLTQECRKLFPGKNIPYPTFLKSHPWESGCTYWLPGLYDPHAVSKESFQPFGNDIPNIHICGESFSLRQAWMEGALENTRDLLRTF